MKIVSMQSHAISLGGATASLPENQSWCDSMDLRAEIAGQHEIALH